MEIQETKTLEDYLNGLNDPRKAAILAFHKEFKNRIYTAKGSKSKHQAWVGGYADHLAETMRLAEAHYQLYRQTRALPFSLDSALIVLYFHDIEKAFKYSEPVETIDPKQWQFEILRDKYGITFSDDEKNALLYIHGEGQDYVPDKRVQGPLAAFCHCCDTTSARIFHDKGKLTEIV